MVTCGIRFHDSVSPKNRFAAPLKWYHFTSMQGLPAETDFVVLGAGIAGLRVAIELAAAGRVLVLAKKDAASPAEAASRTPDSPGVDALSDEDQVSLHLQDTLAFSDGLCNPAAAKILVEEGIERVEELIAWAHH